MLARVHPWLSKPNRAPTARIRGSKLRSKPTLANQSREPSRHSESARRRKRRARRSFFQNKPPATRRSGLGLTCPAVPRPGASFRHRFGLRRASGRVQSGHKVVRSQAGNRSSLAAGMELLLWVVASLEAQELGLGLGSRASFIGRVDGDDG